MFEREKTDGYFKRASDALTALPRRFTLFLILAVILLTPFPTTVVPEWRLRVVDQNGQPFVGEEVSEIWQHYSLESDWHSEDRRTDENGHVVFPERKIWSPLLWRIVSTGLAAVLSIAHGSMGVDAWVMVIRYSTNGGTRDYKPGSPLPGEIVLRR